MLKRLYLDNNTISTVQEGAFNGLPALSVLSLTGNRLETLEWNVFDSTSPPSPTGKSLLEFFQIEFYRIYKIYRILGNYFQLF